MQNLRFNYHLTSFQKLYFKYLIPRKFREFMAKLKLKKSQNLQKRSATSFIATVYIKSKIHLRARLLKLIKPNIQPSLP